MARVDGHSALYYKILTNTDGIPQIASNKKWLKDQKIRSFDKKNPLEMVFEKYPSERGKHMMLKRRRS
jgi:hypothetical protein